MTNQDRPPNWREDGQLYLVRCFACDKERGKENWAMAVSSGICAWCGWREDTALDGFFFPAHASEVHND